MSGAPVLRNGQYSDLMVGEKPHSLHLVEDRIMSGVDLISSIHISSQQKAVQSRTHQLLLVGGGVGSQHVCAVQVVIVSFFPTGMIWRNEQAIEVLLHRHHWPEIVMYRKEWVSGATDVRAVEMVFDAFFNKPQGVVGPVVKLTANFRQDFSRHIGHVISWVDMAENFYWVFSNTWLRSGAVRRQDPAGVEIAGRGEGSGPLTVSGTVTDNVFEEREESPGTAE